MLCLNGSCRQTCSETEQCSNLLDRCASGVCQPDRRPLGECVLNEECPAGSVCLDGSCVDACAGAPDGGVCLAPRPAAGKPAVSEQSPRPALTGVEPRALPLADAGTPAPGTELASPAEPVSAAPEPALGSPPVASLPASSAPAEPPPVSSAAESDPAADGLSSEPGSADAGAPAL
jgi:hypothetical protein